MEQELKIKIKVGQDGSLSVVNSGLSEMRAGSDNAAIAIDQLTGRIKTMGHIGVLGFGSWKAIIQPITDAAKAGIQYNSTLEQTQLALKATIASYVDSATMSGKLAGAQALAATQMGRLTGLAAQSGLAFGELSQSFKTFLPGALKAGMSLDQAANASARLTAAGKLMGLEMGAIIAGIDGVASGTILANSDFGRFLSGVGLTSDALKEAAASGKQYELIEGSLE
ncbi:hypothetical protein AGMMS50229_18730 [Campylobacterota bacterium]|nr:hypothetical protein AGMMS50229_18730 [Campylobacterota bacterium]